MSNLYAEEDLSTTDQERLHHALDYMYDAMGENIPHELMVDACVALNFDADRAVDWLLNHPGASSVE